MQPVNHQKRNTEFTAILAIFEIVSLLGLAYTALILLGVQISSTIPYWRMLVYGVWFAISVVSTYGMIIGKKWGAYVLGIATLIVTAVDIFAQAPLEGAMLGICVALLLAAYLSPSLTELK